MGRQVEKAARHISNHARTDLGRGHAYFPCRDLIMSNPPARSASRQAICGAGAWLTLTSQGRRTLLALRGSAGPNRR
jgi:hypothetical protein